MNILIVLHCLWPTRVLFFCHMIECFERINELNNAIRLKVLVIAVQMTVIQLQKCSSPGSTCKTIKFASINSKKKRLRSNERAVFDESLIIEWVTKYLRSPSLHTMRPHQTPAPGPREPRPSVWARGWDQLSHWHRPESYLATQLKRFNRTCSMVCWRH